MSQLSTLDGQSIGVSVSASVLPMKIQGWFPLRWTGLTSLLSKRQDSQECSLVPHFENINFLTLSLLYVTALTSIHDYRKNHRFDYMDFCMSPHFNMLSRFIIPFLSRRKCLLILWLQSPSAVILEPKKIKSVTVSIVSPFICHEVMGPDAMILIFEC